MLVLKRKKDQEILIGNDIRVVVTEIHGGQVSLGITAPLHVTIDRAETVARRAEEALQAVRRAQGKAVQEEDVKCTCGASLGYPKAGDSYRCLQCGCFWEFKP